MIEITNDWNVKVPNPEHIIGFIGENMVHTMFFRGDGLIGFADWMFQLILRQDGVPVIVDLVAVKSDDCLYLTCGVNQAMLPQVGYVSGQIKATNSVGREKHTNRFNLAILESVTTPPDPPPIPPPSTGGTGQFALEIVDGHLFIVYPDSTTPQNYSINTAGHLILEM